MLRIWAVTLVEKAGLWLILEILVFSLFGCHSTMEQADASRTGCKTCPVPTEHQDTLQFVEEVMQFVAKNADDGLLPNSFCDSFSTFSIKQFPVARYLELFDNDQGTASCGLAANMMVKILLDNGIDAYSYSFGFSEEQLSHVVVLVKFRNEFLVYDPYVNYSLVTDLGAPLCLTKLIETAADSLIVFNFASNLVTCDLNVDMSLVDDSAFAGSDETCRFWISDFKTLRGSIQNVRIERSYSAEVNRPCGSFMTRIENELRKRTSLRNFHQAMLIKTHPVSGASDAAVVDGLLNALIAKQSYKWIRIR